AGLPPASANLTLPDSIDAVTAASILLYRGLSLELQRQFPEAASDYFAFLRLEAASQRSTELRKRVPYVEAQSVRTLARRYRDDGEIAPTETFSGGARFTVGVFPLFNESSLLAMSQLAFGLTGVLRNTLSLLDFFTDRPLPPVPYAHVRWVLDEILPQEVYTDPGSVPASELARILDADFLVVGRLNEVVGSLTGNLTIGRAASEEDVILSEVQSSYSQAGLRSLQLELALALADSVQSMTGFEYVPSREAYADSIDHYLIPDVEQFFDYGYAMEQLLIGDPVEGRILLLNSGLPLAQRDLPALATVFTGDTPPADNLFILTATPDDLAIAMQAAYDDSVAAAVATADSIRATRPRMTTATRPAQRSSRTEREVVVVSATASQVLGPAAVGMPRLDAFNAPGFRADDPRIGKSGTLDPTRQNASIPIRVRIPVPNETHRARPSEKE
ncbi:MAG TPA: hypothetical protein VGA18_03720, partial [Rhodothermales bacterium]